MLVDLVPVQAYVVRKGRTEIEMRVVSEWEGFRKLEDVQKRVLILGPTSTQFTEVFNSIFDKNYCGKVEVLAGTPDLLHELRTAEGG